MALNFGHDEHPPNNIHNIKPLVALPKYRISELPIRWVYTRGVNRGWIGPELEHQGVTKRNIITQIRVNDSYVSWVIPKNSTLSLHSHIFDDDTNITNLTMRYEMVCTMIDGTYEDRLIEEFDVMPFKLVPGIADGSNTFLYDKKYFISDLQPNYAKMAMFYIRIKAAASTQSVSNESVLNVIIYNSVDMTATNKAIIDTIGI